MPRRELSDPELQSIADEQGDVEIESSEKMIEMALAEVTDTSARVNLYRLNDRNKFAYVTSYGIEQWELENVKKEFGGGEYKILVFAPCGKRGQLGIKKQVRFSIDKTFKPASQVQAETVAQASNGNNNGFEVMRLIMETKENSFREMMMLMQENSKQQSQMMMACMATLASAMGGNKTQSTGLDDFIKLKNALGDPTEKFITVFQKGLELGGGGEKESFFDKLMTGLAPALAPMVAGVIAKTSTPTPFPPPQIPATDIEPVKSKEEQMRLAIFSLVNELKNRAEKNATLAESERSADVKQIAVWLVEELDDLDETLTDKIADFVEDANWPEVLRPTCPIPGVMDMIDKYKDFLARLRPEFLALMGDDEPGQSDDDAKGDSAGQDGDMANAG